MRKKLGLGKRAQYSKNRLFFQGVFPEKCESRAVAGFAGEERRGVFFTGGTDAAIIPAGCLQSHRNRFLDAEAQRCRDLKNFILQ
jgi:hypothetical protein